MIREAIATGDTVEQARENACRMLGVDTGDAEFEILKLPTKKTLGIFGGSLAEVRVFINETPKDKVLSYLKGILDILDIKDIDIASEEKDGFINISLSGEDVSFIIGHRGETLDALQYLMGLVANHADNSYCKVSLDVGNYREKRRETLEMLGKKMAIKAAKNRKSYSLEPMNPYERRIIHMAVQSVSGAKSWSEGEEGSRHVVIASEEKQGYVRNNSKGRRNYSSRKNYSASEETNESAPVKKRTETMVDEGTTALYGRIEINK